MIRARLRRLVEGIEPRVGRRVYGAQYRSDAAVWKYLRKRVDAELRQRDAAWQGYTAGLTEAQIQAKIAADPAFVGAEQVANEAIHDLLRGREEVADHALDWAAPHAKTPAGVSEATR